MKKKTKKKLGKINAKQCKVDPESALGKLVRNLKNSKERCNSSYSDSAGYSESYGVSGGYSETGYSEITD